MSTRTLCLLVGAWFSALGIAMQLAATFGHSSQRFADVLGGLCVWACLVACSLARTVEA